MKTKSGAKYIRRFWTEEERKLLSVIFPNDYTINVCKLLNRSYRSVCSQAHLMGLHKSDSFMKMELEKQAQRLRIVGQSSRFDKGHVPENKGKKQPEYMSKEAIERTVATRFKKGQRPHNTKAEGEEVLRLDKNGRQYWMIKIANGQKLVYKHIYLWNQHNGPVPKGLNIVFRDGVSLNCVIENLECISNSELMERNSIHRYPPELKSTIKLFNKLKKIINEKQN